MFFPLRMLAGILLVVHLQVLDKDKMIRLWRCAALCEDIAREHEGVQA